MELKLTRISLGELEAAINKARLALPSQGVEGSLESDVAALGGLYGKMIYYRQCEVPMELLTDSEQIALLNWMVE